MTKPPKKPPAKKAKVTKPSRTRTHAREEPAPPAEPTPPKLTRAERKAMNKAAHAARQAEASRKAETLRMEALLQEGAETFDRQTAPKPPPETIISAELVMDAEPAAAPDETPILAPTRERYRPEYARIAAEMVKLGATRADLARAFGVSDESVRQWRLRHAEFAEALRLADAHVVAACEATLFEVAIGTTMEQTKVVNTPEGPARVKYIESLPPNVTALTKILTNRAPDRWGKDGKVELTGPNGTPLIPPGQEPDAERQRLELARKVGFMLGSALAKVRKAGERPDGLEILATAKDITPPDPAKPSHARAREAPSAAREMTGDGITALTVPKAPGPAYTPEHRETFEEMKRQAVERMRAKYGKQGGGNGE